MSDEVKQLKEILSDGRYQIPDYQRGYDWRAKHVRDFMYDLRRVVVSNNDDIDDTTHYFGTIVRVRSEDSNELVEDSVQEYFVLDGQQRLTTTSLTIGYLTRRILDGVSEMSGESAELLRDATERDRERFAVEDCTEGVSELSASDFRFLPSDSHDTAYRNLITGKKTSSVSTPSEGNMVSAMSVIKAQVDEICDEITISEEDAPDALEKEFKMKQILRNLLNNFVVTRYTVDNPDDAGIFFQAVNDRGKNLNTADEVKSYLVHVASRDNIDKNSTDIHEAFTEVKSKLHGLGGDVENHLDTFTQQHWYMFTGQLEIDEGQTIANRKKASSIIDQIKYGEGHLHRKKSAEYIENWIQVYTESLKEASEAYCEIVEPHNHFETGEFTDLLYAIEQFMPSRQMSGRLGIHMAFKNRRSRYKTVLDVLETLVIRTYEVPVLDNSRWRRKFAAIGCDLFWDTRSESRSKIIGKESDKTYEVEGLEDNLENLIKAEDNIDISDFKKRIGESGLLNGGHFHGWGGARHGQEFALYLLYNFETQKIRNENSALGSLKPYSELKEGGDDIVTYEHIWPENGENGMPDWVNLNDPDQYGDLIQYIGNGLLLLRTDNSGFGNRSYAHKYEDYLSNDSGMATADRLPNPNDPGWTEEKIKERSERISDWAAEYWALESE